MFFKKSLQSKDGAVYGLILEEIKRQRETLQLIASENFVSKAVLEAQGSVFTNKYAEGYPVKRYYSGCEFVDKIENLAIERVCKLFNCKYANVQPHSGSQANQAVFLALLKPGDTILGLSMNSGGHLTHGASPNMSGKWFNVVSYEVDKKTYLIDMDEVRQIAKRCNPKLIIAGASAYSRRLDFEEFRKIADEVGAYLLADIAHYAGLIAGGVYPSPMDFAHVATSTTHKTLRGPRGGIIISNHEEIMKKINSAIFPGLQGGPLMHIIAAKAVAFGEALEDDFKVYVQNVIKSAQTLSDTLLEHEFNVISGGTDSHVVLVDLRNKGLKGNSVALLLEKAGITCNKNSVPFDTESPFVTSGLRFGSPAEVSRGLREREFVEVGNLIADLIHEKTSTEATRSKVKDLCLRFSDNMALSSFE